MTTDLQALHSVDRLEIVESVRPRVADVAAEGQDVDGVITAVLDELTPAAVTAYLPILVERQVRARLHQAPPTP